ncbi:DNA topoisomerase IB [Winogradskyella ursingii]|uniref:DNA topoisomerase IB n=1 Tax=Winogradskyella ursingii TaxID=2686079 RepID=UPI0015CC5AA8|nr:DNA topoisomerase IB [Winogradskyella ursingii]
MKSQKINLEFANQLYTDPELLIDNFGLVYASDEILDIERRLRDGNFFYLKNGKKISSDQTISRINNLVIPPAWKDVRIASIPKAHMQAIGRDEKGRKQYKYHELWSTLRNQTKFFKMYAFGEQLPKLRRRVNKDLKGSDWNLTKVLALVVKLLEETHIRIGNSYYAKSNNTYGLSTLRSKHVDIYNNRMKFEFVGKRGKEHSVTVKNKKLIRLVERCEEIPGWELFKYYDKHGEKHTINSTMVNNYIHDISGDLFTAKDFRTWGASKICFETLMSIGLEENEDKAKKNVLTAIDAAAKALGNTRNVVRKYYAHPLITESYIDSTIAPYFSKKYSKKYSGLNHTESSMLSLISTYKPNLKA